MSKRSETMTIRLSSEMKAELAKLAKSERRSTSQMAVLLLEEALEARTRHRAQ
jgi:predicted transcriptional regulator